MNPPRCCLCEVLLYPWYPGAAGYGHNPDPLGEEGDRCCDNCNDTRVIPARLAKLGHQW